MELTPHQFPCFQPQFAERFSNLHARCRAGEPHYHVQPVCSHPAACRDTREPVTWLPSGVTTRFCPQGADTHIRNTLSLCFFFSFSPKSRREVRHGETGPFAQGLLAAASPEEESPDFLASCHTCEGLLALMTVKALQ